MRVALCIANQLNSRGFLGNSLRVIKGLKLLPQRLPVAEEYFCYSPCCFSREAISLLNICVFCPGGKQQMEGVSQRCFDAWEVAFTS